jgi:thioredoxin-dependent peroxiredoxin
MSACQTTVEEFEVTNKSVNPGADITWVGKQTRLIGTGHLQVGSVLPTVQLTNLKMEQTPLGRPGQVVVIDTIPSIDTPVCDRQTHILGSATSLDPSVQRMTISLDLPYAQRRFAEEAKIANIDFLSDYRAGEFTRLSVSRSPTGGSRRNRILEVMTHGACNQGREF